MKSMGPQPGHLRLNFRMIQYSWRPCLLRGISFLFNMSLCINLFCFLGMNEVVVLFVSIDTAFSSPCYLQHHILDWGLHQSHLGVDVAQDEEDTCRRS